MTEFIQESTSETYNQAPSEALNQDLKQDLEKAAGKTTGKALLEIQDLKVYFPIREKKQYFWEKPHCGG